MHIRTLKDEGGVVIREFLKILPKENWSVAYFPESFNAWIVDHRHLPIYQLLDGIKVKIMEMNAHRRQKSLESRRHWDVSRSRNFLFEVHGEDSVMVDLQSCTCRCRMWQIKEFPCAHVLVTILKNDKNHF
ncbi:unnamed protein product [Prunus brigantina]